MKTFMYFLFGLVVVVAVAVLVKRKDVFTKAKSVGSDSTPPYFGKKPLSEAEQVLFHRLKEAMPEYVVLAQVALSALVGIRKNPQWQSQFNQISRKYVDYVLCRPDFTVVAVVELDDSTHRRADRKAADTIKDDAFRAVNYTILRYTPNALPTVEEIRRTITGAANQHPIASVAS